MKRNVIIVIFLGIIIGYVFGNLIYKNYNGLEYIEEDGNIYYVQYGVYVSKEAALKNVMQLDNYIIKENDDKFYVYLGITTTLNTALKIQNYYEERDIHTYIRSDYVENSETLSKLKEYDTKLEKLETNEELTEVIKEIFKDTALNF